MRLYRQISSSVVGRGVAAARSAASARLRVNHAGPGRARATSRIRSVMASGPGSALASEQPPQDAAPAPLGMDLGEDVRADGVDDVLGFVEHRGGGAVVEAGRV